MAAEMVPLNDSLGVDLRLWQHDLQGSRAWARAIAAAGVLDASELTRILEGLARVSVRLSDGDWSPGGDEDVHSLVERLLHEEVGEIAGKLHTGRSRNDQIATDVRLWGLEALKRIETHHRRLLEALIGWAERSVDIVMPGFTHLQQGQPVRAAHWVLSHFWPLRRDLGRFPELEASISVLPLGSGAIAGCPFPIDREALRAELGFSRISENSIDAVSDRDWTMDVLYAAARIGLHVSRLAEDLVLFSSQEFSYLRLSDGFSTGSSLMPQKRNPDAAELARGQSARLVGGLTAFMTLVKGLPTGYNRDLQEDKALLFGAIDTLDVLLPAVAGAIEGAEFDEAGIRTRLDPRALATDLADQLVRSGVPFRSAHEVVAGIVRRAEESGIGLDALDTQVFVEAHAVFARNPPVLDFEASVEARDVPGGTARGRVQEQIDAARASLT
jgi:argininosuccinate lyase